MREPIIRCTCHVCKREKPIDNMRRGKLIKTDNGIKVPLICPSCYPSYRAMQAQPERKPSPLDKVFKPKRNDRETKN